MALDAFDTSVYLVLSVLSILASTFVLFTYISCKALRKHPSSILAWLSIFDIMMNYHTIPWAVDTETYIRFFALDRIMMVFTGEEIGHAVVMKCLCTSNLVILSTSLVASICYNIIICVDLILTLWSPFSPGYKRAKYYHIVAVIVIAYCSVYLNYINNFEVYCTVAPRHRMEISNSGTVGFLLLTYLVISLFSVCYASYRFYVGLGIKTEIRVRYLQRHIAYVIAFCFCWIWPGLSGLLNYFKADSYMVTEIAIVTTSLSGCLLSIIRSSEPLIWKNLNVCKKQKCTRLESNVNDDMCNKTFADSVTQQLSNDITRCILTCVQERLCCERVPGPFDYSIWEKVNMTDSVKLVVSDLNEASQFAQVEVTEYAPEVFNDIRDRSNVSNEQLEHALNLRLNQDQILKAKESCGKSGSFMFVSHDKTLVLKTISVREKHCLQKRLLKPYHDHLQANPKSVLCRFFGLFTLRISGIASVDIVVMEGVLRAVKRKGHCYDLKGSTYNRSAAENNRSSKSITLLDLDLFKKHEEIRISDQDKADLMDILEADAALLAKQRIMDYSLLLCVDSTNIQQDSPLPRNVIPSLDGSRSFHIGIIDFLTVYNHWKVIENKYKTLWHGAMEISAIHPDQYFIRFLNFIQIVILGQFEKSRFSLTEEARISSIILAATPKQEEERDELLETAPFSD